MTLTLSDTLGTKSFEVIGRKFVKVDDNKDLKFKRNNANIEFDEPPLQNNFMSESSRF